MKVDFTGKVAVVTGGCGVLCRVFAQKLAACGAKVAILDINKEMADKAAEDLKAAGGEAIGVACDVTNLDSIRAAEQAVFSAYGNYHILINGAGINPAAACTTREFAEPGFLDLELGEEITLFNLPSDAVDAVMRINFLGTFNVTKVFAKRMAAVDDSVIINISSMSGILPLTKAVGYSASKSAINSLTQWLSTHLAKLGIRVNAIAPGFFLTPINEHLLLDKNGEYTDRSKKIIAGTPMARFGSPEELLGALLFLCDSEASRFVTGVVIPVDGGFSAYCGV